MRQTEQIELVKFVERGNVWQKRCLIALAKLTGEELPEATRTEWATEYAWVEEWLSDRNKHGDKVMLPRELWAEIYSAIELYAVPQNWKPYEHKSVGTMPAVIPFIGHAAAKRVYDQITPQLFGATLEPEKTAP